MKAPPFRYVKPATLNECLSLLAAHGDEAQILAGGQSLMPMLNLRLARPTILIDINGLAELDGIAEHADGITVGAMTRHADILTPAPIQKRLPLLIEAGRHIAHVAIRSRGTLGGSLSLADPAAEWPACALALNAEMELESNARGSRRVPAVNFFQGLYTTARQPDELLTRVVFPTERVGGIHAFDEIARRHGDFAMAGIALVANEIVPRVRGIKISLLGVADRPVLAVHTMAVLEGSELSPSRISAAVEALRQEIDPPDDPGCPTSYRRHIAGTLLERILGRLMKELPHGA
ncbi:MAG: FAD binding domain-containing protein [Hyphomicrobiaceae bacterium]